MDKRLDKLIALSNPSQSLSQLSEKKLCEKLMNKTAIKNFAIWARNKLIADISYQAGLLGITEAGIARALPQSSGTTEFYDTGIDEPYEITGEAIRQRRSLTERIRRKEADTDYATAYKYIIEEVAYTWFNRLIAVRFMEVNDYLPARIRVLSSESGKIEPDIVTNPFDAELDLSSGEKSLIMQLKSANKLDELFQMLFIKQCNALNAYLPALFEKTNDYTELLLNLSVIDQDGVVWHLVNDIPEDDFNVERGGQVEIIGWLYQYYNEELNGLVYDGNMSKSKISKELLPAATTIYTPDWVVRYMVENSLGRLWMEGHPNENLNKNWKYYLEEAEQETEVQAQLAEIRKEHAKLSPEDLTCIDPCMGSGHILVYLFDVLMQIYESQGWSQRDAAQSILVNNLYGLDIDDRAAQMAYFAVMMKARQYDRRIFTRHIQPHVYAIAESNHVSADAVKYLCNGDTKLERAMQTIIKELHDAKEYGSILTTTPQDWTALYARFDEIRDDISLYRDIALALEPLVQTAQALGQKYHATVTNPPYLGSSRFSSTLDAYVKKKYADVKSDLSMVMLKRSLSEFSKKNGFVSFITTSSWMFLSSFEKLRTYMFENTSIDSLVDFGTELFEGKVGHNPIVAWVNRNAKIRFTMNAIRLVDYCYSRRDEKIPEFFRDRNRFIARQENFSKIPGSPVAYWVSDVLIEDFCKGEILKTTGDTRQGMATSDNGRFLRLWYEVDKNKIGMHCSSASEAASINMKWYPYNKGGDYRKWYGNIGYVLNYENDGLEVKEYAQSLYHTPSRTIKSMSEYFKPCLSWSKVTSGKTAFRYYPKGFVFDVAGCCIFYQKEEIMFYHCGFLNSNVAKTILDVISPTLNYEAGQIASLPIVYEDRYLLKIQDLVKKNIQMEKNDWNLIEISWDFKIHPLLECYKGTRDVTYTLANIDYYYKGNSPEIRSALEAAYYLWKFECDERFRKLKENEEELNRIFIDIYGLQDELTPDVADKDVTVRRIFDSKDDIPEEMRGWNYALTKRDVVISLISYAVGCMFGRYSLDQEGLVFAGGTWEPPKESYWLDTGAMWRDKRYISFLPDEDNCIPITDEEYFQDDIVSLFCAWMKATFGEQQLEQNLDFIAQALGNRGNTSREVIRNYFLKDFYKDHCKTYQKRPIYWLFDSGKQNGFKALVYMHRWTADTIGTVNADYLLRSQRVYESEINRMQDMADHSQNPREAAAASKRKEKLSKQLKECKEYYGKLSHLALERIDIDLDDGVKVNYRKVQTGSDGKFYKVLADSKSIIAKRSSLM